MRFRRTRRVCVHATPTSGVNVSVNLPGGLQRWSGLVWSQDQGLVSPQFADSAALVLGHSQPRLQFSVGKKKKQTPKALLKFFFPASAPGDE